MRGSRRLGRDEGIFFQQIIEDRDDLGGKGKEKVRVEKKEREKKGAFPGMPLMTPYFSLSSYCSIFFFFLWLFSGYFFFDLDVGS